MSYYNMTTTCDGFTITVQNNPTCSSKRCHPVDIKNLLNSLADEVNSVFLETDTNCETLISGANPAKWTSLLLVMAVLVGYVSAF
jgi:hypothetical protein